MPTLPLGMKSEPQPAVKQPWITISLDTKRSELLERLYPYIDCLEVVPDTLQASSSGYELDGRRLSSLKQAATQVSMIAHGVGLSIGTQEGMREDYLRRLEVFLSEIPCVWHSEHLGFTHVNGRFLGTMIPIPRTDEMLDLVCERINQIQQRFKIPFLVENVIRLLPEPPATYSDAAFLNEITRRTGCGLLLDAYNLECDVHNGKLDLERFLDELDLSKVREIHVARGKEQDGFLLDVHANICHDSTLDLAKRILAGAQGAVEAITFELLDEAVASVGEDAIVAQMEKLKNHFGQHP